MLGILALIFSVLISFQRSVIANHTCYAEDREPYMLTATKTGYFPVMNVDDSEIKHEGCKAPDFIWFLARHGTRYPSDIAMQPMKNLLPKIRNQVVHNHKQGRGTMCSKDLANLKNWRFSLTPADALLLTESGKEEMRGLGRRWKNRLGNLTDLMVVSEETFGFTNTQRTKESARHFKEAFLSESNSSLPTYIANKELLHFFKICDRYKEAIFQKKTTAQEVKDLFRSYTLPSLKNLVETINIRLGYQMKTITFKAMELMWDMCRWEISWNYEIRPWCAVFSKDEMKLFEDNEDLFFHFQDGYAYNITRDMTGVLLRDLFDRISDHYENNSSTSNRFYFAHSETFMPFLTRLGIAKDTPPLGLDNLPKNRKWRTSLIGGESSNLAVVGLECDDGIKLKFFLNEREVEIEGCPKNICDITKFKDKYEPLSFSSIQDVCSPS